MKERSRKFKMNMNVEEFLCRGLEIADKIGVKIILLHRAIPTPQGSFF